LLKVGLVHLHFQRLLEMENGLFDVLGAIALQALGNPTTITMKECSPRG